MSLHVLSEVLSFLDINEYQFHSLPTQVLTYWLGNTNYSVVSHGNFEKKRNGVLHTGNNSPSIHQKGKVKMWHKCGARHRGGDLPAVIWMNGTKEWWYWHGIRHRLHGPAVICRISGYCEWWFNGVKQDGELSLRYK